MSVYGGPWDVQHKHYLYVWELSGSVFPGTNKNIFRQLTADFFCTCSQMAFPILNYRHYMYQAIDRAPGTLVSKPA